MKRLFTSAVALFAMAGAAQAADLIAEQPIMAVEDSASFWDGFYAGVSGGFGTGRVDYTDIGAIVAVDPAISGGLVGATLGYNAQFDNIVLGVEGDLSWANLSGSLSNGGVVFQSNVNWVGTLRGRIGIDLDPVLLYATAGLAAGGLTTTLDVPGATAHNGTHVGFAVGAGAEAMVTDDISIKAEYLYLDLGRRDIPDGALFPLSTANTAHPTAHVFRVGANFHF